jgi:hypothetical protein
MGPLLLEIGNQRKIWEANRKVQESPNHFQEKIRYQKDIRILNSIGEQLGTNFKRVQISYKRWEHHGTMDQRGRQSWQSLKDTIRVI